MYVSTEKRDRDRDKVVKGRYNRQQREFLQSDEHARETEETRQIDQNVVEKGLSSQIRNRRTEPWV